MLRAARRRGRSREPRATYLLLAVGGQRHRVSRLESVTSGSSSVTSGSRSGRACSNPSRSRRLASPSSDPRHSHHSWHIPTPPGIDSNDDDPRLQRAQGRSTNRVLAPRHGPPRNTGRLRHQNVHGATESLSLACHVVSVVYAARRGRAVRTGFDSRRITLGSAVRPSTRPLTASGYFSMSRAADVHASVPSRESSRISWCDG